MPAPPDGPYRVRTAGTARDFRVVRGAVHDADGAPVDATLIHVSGAQYVLRRGAQVHRVVVEARGEDGAITLSIDGQRVEASVQTARELMLERFGVEAGTLAAQREVRAPMPGLVLGVFVEVGATVEAGERLAILEAMKMENDVRAAHGGVIKTVHAAPGQAVGKNALLFEFES